MNEPVTELRVVRGDENGEPYEAEEDGSANNERSFMVAIGKINKEKYSESSTNDVLAFIR
jgi:hypothetical protein